MSRVKKAVLAYSGGVDTSVCIPYLKKEYGVEEVIAFAADLGQGDELESIKQKAFDAGASQSLVVDLISPFIKDFAFPAIRANALYQGRYPLSTALARPLIAKHLVDVARELGADALAHGCTGKGNDQVRFELGAYALNPNIKIIAPWREWDLGSRKSLLDYAAKHGIPVEMKRGNESPYSMDANLLHISYEGGPLEDPWKEPSTEMWRWTVNPENAPNEATYLDLEFANGDPIGIDDSKMSPAELLAELNRLGGINGIGRTDIVENRYVGMKSRGAYETPGGTILLKAHRAIESITLDRGVAHLKDELMPKYAELIYNGYWFSPEREMLQTAIDHSQRWVNGKVKVKLYKGSIEIVGRESEDTLFDEAIATFEDDAGAYNQADAEGFIRLNALRLRTESLRDLERGGKQGDT